MDAVTKEKIRKTGIGISSVLAMDTLDLSLIFYFATVFKPLFESILKFALLPIAFISSWIVSALTLRQAYLKNFPGQLTAKAIIEFVCAAALTASILGGFIAAAAFAVAGPAVIACAFGFKSLYNLGSAIYFGVKAAKTTDPSQKYELKKQAIESAISGCIGALSTAGVITVLLLAKPFMAILGIMAGAIGCTAAVIKGIDLVVQKPSPTIDTYSDQPQKLSTNAKIVKSVNLTKNALNSASEFTLESKDLSIEKTGNINLPAQQPAKIEEAGNLSPILK
ncbi:MAG TPA: hypothetical protein VL360_00645 [Gammaproteobacteria bacterium]|jgi:hypothetical protein|nr:hypothetical protein [Gammaproteobacteria bacterium]